MIKNSTFCMFPWVHMYIEPSGRSFPCCIGDYNNPYGDISNSSIKDVLNSPSAKKLRLDMINDIPNKMCDSCYISEKTNPELSLRQFANTKFGKYFDEVMNKTETDGTINDPIIRYLDIRFSNICNFKCRTCGDLLSSSIASEDKKLGKTTKIIIKPRKDNSLLEETLLNLDYVDYIYFAGGEPLIMEEHYVILEELNKRKKFNIKLRYNSNCSNFKYKDKDLFDLWKNFNHIEFVASIDHYGEKAEYIRHGTDWGLVESNLVKLRQVNNIEISINTVLSIFNYLTLNDFYTYLTDKKIIKHSDSLIGLYRSTSPDYLCSKTLTSDLKSIGKVNNIKLIEYLTKNQFTFTQIIKDAISFTEEDSTINLSDKFKKEITIRDQLRNESFVKTFPELRSLFD